MEMSGAFFEIRLSIIDVEFTNNKLIGCKNFNSNLIGLDIKFAKITAF